MVRRTSEEFRDLEQNLTAADINPTHWYQSDTMDKVIEASAVEAGYESVSQVFNEETGARRDVRRRGNVVLGTIPSSGRVADSGSDMCELFREMLATEQEGDRFQVLLPVNTGAGGGDHWRMLQVEFEKDGDGEYVLNRNYYDPMGQGCVIPDIDKVVIAAFYEASGGNISVESKARGQRSTRQSDGSSCGAVSAEIAFNLMRGEPALDPNNPAYPAGAVDLRLEQLRRVCKNSDDYMTAYGMYKEQPEAAKESSKLKTSATIFDWILDMIGMKTSRENREELLAVRDAIGQVEDANSLQELFPNDGSFAGNVVQLLCEKEEGVIACEDDQELIPDLLAEVEQEVEESFPEPDWKSVFENAVAEFGIQPNSLLQEIYADCAAQIQDIEQHEGVVDPEVYKNAAEIIGAVANESRQELGIELGEIELEEENDQNPAEPLVGHVSWVDKVAGGVRTSSQLGR